MVTGSFTLDTLSRELVSETRNMIEIAVGRAENGSFRGLNVLSVIAWYAMLVDS